MKTETVLALLTAMLNDVDEVYQPIAYEVLKDAHKTIYCHQQQQLFPLTQEEQQLAQTNKFEAIKAYRQRSNCGVYGSKLVVEAYLASLPLPSESLEQLGTSNSLVRHLRQSLARLFP